MIDISSYRQQIGTFSQKIRKIKFPRDYCIRRSCFSNSNTSQSWVQLFVVISTLFLLSFQNQDGTTFRSQHIKSNSKSLISLSSSNTTFLRPAGVGMIGNFYGRYINGNIKSIPKGVRVYHLNIRSLQNKVGEIKKITNEKKPHIFGLSEVELKVNSPGFNMDKLKVPGYKLLLPKSWDKHGYARVAVYVKKPLIMSGLEN